MKDFIENNLLTKTGKLISSRLNEQWFTKNGFQDFYEKMSKYQNYSEFLYLEYNRLLVPPLCETCGGKVNFKNFSSGYYKFCSAKCSSNNKQTREKYEKTNIEKYGSKSPMQCQTVKDKSKKTTLKKYGCENVLQSPIIKEKIKQTTLERYGVEHNSQNEGIKKKKKNTNLERYGVEHNSQIPEVKEQKKQTFLNNFGVEFPSQSPIIKEKIKQTNLERYGVECVMQSAEIREKIKQTNLEKYGVYHHNQDRECLSFLEDKKWLYDQHHLKKKTLEEISKEIGVTGWTVGRYCKIHDIPIRKFSISSYEKEISDFIQSFGIKVENNDKTVISPLEVDIYLPDYKFGIEFNGLYWHSNKFKDEKYHINKTNFCKEKGITLIHIFEDEWVEKKEIIKSIIMTKLGKCKNKIFARNTLVRKISSETAKKFIEENHIQGFVASKEYYSLWQGEELVSVFSVGESRFEKNKFEIIRFCSKLNTIVIGGFGKLLKEAKKDYFELYSYTNLRFFDGGVYKKYGKFVRRTKPGYFWVKKDKRISRYKTQKKLLTLLLDNFDENISETQNMINNGYIKIFDCGNDLYLL